MHKASAAGESPPRFRFLVRSIQMQPDLDNLRVQVVSLATIAPYAKRLEFGDLSSELTTQTIYSLKAYKPKAKSD